MKRGWIALVVGLAWCGAAGAVDVCNCKGSTLPGGPCYAGPGGPAYDGPGGPAYAGPGGPCYRGPGGQRYAGPGGPAYAGPGGPRYAGPGGPAYAGPGGPAYAGPGGPCHAGPGGPCYPGPGGNLERCPDVCFDSMLSPGRDRPGSWRFGGSSHSGSRRSAYDGPGGPAYAGPGGPCYAGPGGPCYAGPGGDLTRCPAVCLGTVHLRDPDSGLDGLPGAGFESLFSEGLRPRRRAEPSWPRSLSTGRDLDRQPGGRAYDGPGGPCYSGPGGPCYSGFGSTPSRCPEICRR